MPKTHRISLNEWLDFFGLRASPFSKWEAEEEARLSPELLTTQWVKPACFDRVLGQASEPRTVLLFAPRGAGKTACRILVEYYCTAGLGHGERATTGGHVLPILYTNLDEALRESETTEQIDEFWHARAILRQGVESLTSQMMVNEALVQAALQLDAASQLDLYWFLNNYPPLSAAKIDFLQERLGFSIILETVRRVGYRQTRTGPPHNFSADDLRMLSQRRSSISTIDQLSLFVDLVCGPARRGLGFEAVYILVDGLDEFLFSADLSTNRAVSLLLPLLANLRLMNARKFAFKFFLPLEVYQQIRQQPVIRHDRLLYETINWTDSDLQEILRRRLVSYGPIEDFDMLCAPELRGVEKDVLRVAQGNPRSVMRLCEFMLQAHIARPLPQPANELGEGAYFLTPMDWQEAQARFAELKPVEVKDHLAPLDEQSASFTESTPGVSEIVLHHYPGPIALVYLDYFRRQESFARLSRLLDLFEVTVAFVGTILLSELRESAAHAMPSKLRTAGLRPKRMGLGGWLAIWEKIPGLCGALGKTFYAPYLQQAFAQECNKLDGLRILRNRTLGHGATLTEEAALELLSQYEPDMMEVLNALSFLKDVHLIQVHHMRKAGASFEHRARKIVGDNPNFPWYDITLTYPLDSDKIMLIGDREPLSLHPFILFARCEADAHEEVFIYQQLEEAAVQYISYSSGHLLTSNTHYTSLLGLIGI